MGIGYIDTSDNVKPEEYTVNSIFAKLDVIEFKTGLMAHEVEGIKDNFELWSNKKISDSFFLNFLNKFIDEL